MLANSGDTEGLFHGAFMQSGAPLPAGDVVKGQYEYDQLVNGTSCAETGNTLECLRGLPYEELRQAVNKFPGIISKQVCFG